MPSVWSYKGIRLCWLLWLLFSLPVFLTFSEKSVEYLVRLQYPLLAIKKGDVQKQCFFVVNGWSFRMSTLRSRWSFAIFFFVQQFFSPFETFGGIRGQWHKECERVSTSNELSFYLCSCFCQRRYSIKSITNGCEVVDWLLVFRSIVLVSDESGYWFIRPVVFFGRVPYLYLFLTWGYL